jgi:very-short-patch-repair endonuclease
MLAGSRSRISDVWDSAFEALGKIVLSRAELMKLGATTHDLTFAVRARQLIRARRDHYVLPGTDTHLVEAVRVGGKLACVSALAAAGLFAFDPSKTHLHLDRTMSRSRSPRDRFVPLTPSNRFGTQLHWSPLIGDDASEYAVGIRDALVQSLRCQQPLDALASLDSALHSRAISEQDLAEIFANAPNRVRHLQDLVDARAESGQETMLRAVIRDTGYDFEPQVNFPEIGRVDFLVDGALVVEADSRLAHEGWEAHVRDRGRDLALAALGYMSLRPAYQHTMNHPELVREAIAALLSRRRLA